MIIAIYFVLFLNFTFSAKSFINSWKNDNIIDKLTEKERLNAEVNPKQLFKKMNSSLNTAESSIKTENTSYKKPYNIYTSNPKPVVENKNNSITSKKYEKELIKNIKNSNEEINPIDSLVRIMIILIVILLVIFILSFIAFMCCST